MYIKQLAQIFNTSGFLPENNSVSEAHLLTGKVNLSVCQ